MAYGGDAVGRAEDGLAVFAWPGIEGEQARVRVTERRPNLLRGVVEEVIEPSALRAAPPCPYFGSCGGCQWQHIVYDGQVGFKHKIVRTQLSRTGGVADLDRLLEPAIASPVAFGYRNTSHFTIDPATRSLGYFRRDSHTIIPVETCPISNRGINAAIPLVNSLLAEAPEEELVREGRGIMRVWGVTVRHSEGTGHTVVVFQTRAGGAARPRRGRGGRRASEPARPDMGPGPQPETRTDVPMVRRQVRRAISGLYSMLDERGEPLALTLVEAMEDGTINMLGATKAAATLAADTAADALTGSLLKIEKGTKAIIGPPLGAWTETLGGRHYWVAPEAFFQANTPAAELLLADVLRHIPQALGLLVDAHAGVGTFALAAAARAKQVLAFETNGSAVDSGRWSADVSNVHNIEFRHGRAEMLLQRLHKDEQPDLLVLDPPRSGCHPDLLAEIGRRMIPRIVYVSCDPSTLARDIKALSANYSLASARVVDMFPQTFHIETVAVLEYRVMRTED
jgi:23S rRNA (uracil1939-C5)-methyltransferase